MSRLAEATRTRQPTLNHREHAISYRCPSCTTRTITCPVGYVSQRERGSIRHMSSLLDG